jgi:hypothetical protein
MQKRLVKMYQTLPCNILKISTLAATRHILPRQTKA